MQTLLLPAAAITTGISSPPVGLRHHRHTSQFLSCFSLPSISIKNSNSTSQFLPFSSPWCDDALRSIGSKRGLIVSASSPVSPSFSSPAEETDKAKLAQVSRTLEKTSRLFKKLGGIGFWGQLVCTIVSAVILSFSIVITGKITSPATFYSTTAGIAAAFVSVFWSFGYIRLSERLRRTSNDPSKAPSRVDVVRGLKNGIVVNLLGMGAAILGMQATVGNLVAKALTSSATPFYQGVSPGYSPVLALDVFLVQASANTILSHFIGLVCSLELLRSTTPALSEGAPVPRVA